MYVVQGNYGRGWEDLTYEDTKEEAKQMLADYDENEVQYKHRIVRR